MRLDGVNTQKLRNAIAWKTALTHLNSNVFNYHWYRQEAGGAWSEKFSTIGQAQIKENTGYRPYTDVQNNTHEAFFCSCNPALPLQ